MKKLIITIIIFVGLFLFATQVFGVLIYNRTPAGTEVVSPVIVNVSFDSFEEVGLQDPSPWTLEAVDMEDCGWGELGIECGNPDYYICYSSTTQSVTASFNLPVGTEINRLWLCYTDEECASGCMGGDFILEGGVEEESIFTIVAPPFIEIPLNFVSSTLAYIGQAVSGLGPFLWFIIGIPLAFWVLWKVTGLMPKK